MLNPESPGAISALARIRSRACVDAGPAPLRACARVWVYVRAIYYGDGEMEGVGGCRWYSSRCWR